MSTLVEFLLARIAEDDALASGRSPEPHGNYCDLVCGDPGGGGSVCDCGYPARVLAECEAKRRIVALHDDVHDYDLWEKHQRGCVRSTRAVVALGVPCGYGLVAGLLSLTPWAAGLGVPRYVVGLLMEAPILALLFVLLMLVDAVVEWVAT